MTIVLDDIQIKAKNELDSGKILVGGVGAGKSVTAAAYYMEKEAPKDVYVITTAKKRDDLDWEKEFGPFGVTTVQGATTAGVLTVDSWNNIGKYEDVKGAFFIFDEQRLVGSGAWTKAFLRIAKSNRWIMLSATPGDTWMDYIPVFLANGFYKNRTEFIREHVVYSHFTKFPKVERYIGVLRLAQLRHQLLVEMPVVRHTTRVSKVIPVTYDKEKFEKVMRQRWHVYEERPLRDVAEMFLVLRKVVNSDISRLEAVKQLLRVHPRLIVFYNFNYELEMLRSLASDNSLETSSKSKSVEDSPTSSGTSSTWVYQALDSLSIGSSKGSSKKSRSGTNPSFSSPTSDRPSTHPDKLESNGPGLTIAEWNGWRHQPIPDTERWLYLVQYTAGAEGWNCIVTDAMDFYSMPYSYKLWEQAHGRIDRRNTPYFNLFYYTQKSNAPIDIAVAKSLAMKKSFNEKRFIKERNGDWSGK